MINTVSHSNIHEDVDFICVCGVKIFYKIPYFSWQYPFFIPESKINNLILLKLK